MFKNRQTPEDIARALQFPESEEQHRRWQAANQAWWESRPMSYDWDRRTEEFSPAFFDRVDEVFFALARVYAPPRRLPFDRLIDYPALAGRDALEIGIGCGTVAELLARHARSFTGIDLTDYSVRATRERFRQRGLEARIARMDAERMAFPDASFDYVWSWGVLHHSSDTRLALSEVARVLRPGGQAFLMVYYRGLWNYYARYGLFFGLLAGDLFRERSVHKVAQLRMDGFIARHFLIPEWKRLVGRHFEVEEAFVLGTKEALVPLPSGRLKNAVLRATPDWLSRFATRRLRMGGFLCVRLRKPV